MVLISGFFEILCSIQKILLRFTVKLMFGNAINPPPWKISFSSDIFLENISFLGTLANILH